MTKAKTTLTVTTTEGRVHTAKFRTQQEFDYWAAYWRGLGYTVA